MFIDKINFLKTEEPARDRARQKVKLPQQLQPADDFLQRLQRERDHADQTGQEFSLVMFEFNGDASNDELVQRLWQMIFSSGKAGFSEMGWLSSQSIGVILPNTPFAKGRKLAEDLYRLMPDATSFCNYKIFTYPPQQEERKAKGEG